MVSPSTASLPLPLAFITKANRSAVRRLAAIASIDAAYMLRILSWRLIFLRYAVKALMMRMASNPSLRIMTKAFRKRGEETPAVFSRVSASFLNSKIRRSFFPQARQEVFSLLRQAAGPKTSFRAISFFPLRCGRLCLFSMPLPSKMLK